MTTTINLTKASKALFTALVKDAPNWGGTPLLGGNVGGSKKDRGNITDLKKKGLLSTFESDGKDWVQFTPEGAAYAKELDLTLGKFVTPHEAASTSKGAAAAAAPATKPAKKAKGKKAPAKAKKASAGRDAFGGRIGSRMSAINLVVINAGSKGATAAEVAAKTGETVAIVSAQLGWAVSHLKVATRKEEKAEGARKAFRYFANAASKK